MPKIVPISGNKMIKILKLSGFELIRIKGSHHFFKNNTTGSVTTAPLHSNEDLGISLIKSILNDANINNNDYEVLRKKA